MEVVKPKLVVDVRMEPNSKPRWTLADALLADLNASATPMATYETKLESHTTTEHVTSTPSSRTTTLDRRQRSPDPPPLPPLPAKDVLDSLHHSQEFYPDRSHPPGQPRYSSTIMISKSVYNTNGDDDGRSAGQGHSRVESTASSSSCSATDPRLGGSQSRRTTSPPQSKPSLLSNNLSELDSLLEDLSSAKFSAEVDRTSQNVAGNKGVSCLPSSGTLRQGSGPRPGGMLQRELEIPKLVVPSTHQNDDFSNYEYVGGGCQTTSVPQIIPIVQESQQHGLVSGSSQNQFYEVQHMVVPTNVQQPPMQQLELDETVTRVRSSPSPTFQMQQQQHLQQRQYLQQQQQPPPLDQVVQVIPQVQGQAMTQQHLGPMMTQDQVILQGQRPMMAQQPQGQLPFNPMGPSQFKQTYMQTYTREEFVNRPVQQQIIGQPMQQQFINQPVDGQATQQQFLNQSTSQQGTIGAQGRTTTASRDLEDLMMSFSEFDMTKNRPSGGEPMYAQPIKTGQGVSSSNAAGDDVDHGSSVRVIQEQGTNGYSASSLGRQEALYDGISYAGGLSPGPQEVVIPVSPSVAGQPVPATVYSQNQSSSKMVMTQGMHGVLPQGVNGQGTVAGEGQLERMLGQLGNDLNQQGIMTIPKGDCAACQKPIAGQVLMALGKIWHPDHFVCIHCRQELGTNIFFERDGQPYCEHDYQILFSPKCALCNNIIIEKCITALNKTWHPDHFFCAHCQRPFGEEGFHEKDGLPFCREDYFRMFAPKCGGCGKAILSNYVTALHRQWHPECFVCRECQAPFDSGSFFDHNGLPYCEQHFHAQRGSLCASCHQPIMGRCIAAMYRKFHPEHFVCVFCLQQLNKGTFKEHDNKPYCHPCFDKLFG